MTDSDKSPLTEEQFLKAAKTTLDQQAQNVDEELRRRLQQARRVAVHASQTPSTSRPGWLIPAGGFAVLAIAISVTYYGLQTIQEPAPLANVEDAPILAAPEDLELYEELDFYQWLAVEHGDVG